MKTCRGQDVNRFLGELGLGPTLRQMNAEFDLFSRVDESMCAWARQHMMQTQAARRADKAARAAIIRDDATDEWDELFGDGDGVENDIAAVFQRLASEAAALASGQEAAATERSDRSHARRLGAVGEEEEDDDDSDEYMAPVSQTSRATSAAEAFAASSFAILAPLVPYLITVLQSLVSNRCLDSSDISAHLSYLVAQLPVGRLVLVDAALKAKCPFCNHHWKSLQGATELLPAHIYTRHIAPLAPAAGAYFARLLGDGIKAYALPEGAVAVSDYHTASARVILEAYVVPLLKPALGAVFVAAKSAIAGGVPLDLVEVLQNKLAPPPAEEPATEPYIDILEEDVLDADDDKSIATVLIQLEKFVPGIVLSALVTAADPNPQPLPGAAARDERRLSLNAAVYDDYAKPHHRALTLSPTLADRLFPVG